MRKIIKWGVVIVTIGLVSVGLRIVVSISGQPVSYSEPNQPVLGFVGPLTGEVAVYGQAVKEGIEFAQSLSDDNKLKVVFEDTQCDPKKSLSAVRKLIFQDRVSGIIGDICSTTTLAIIPLIDEARLVLVSPTSSSPELSGKSPNFFRVIPSDLNQGKFVAEQLKKKGIKRLAVIYANTDYGQGLFQVLKQNFEQDESYFVASEAVEESALDLRVQLAKIKASKPELLYLILAPKGAATAIKQVSEMDWQISLYGSEALKEESIVTSLGNIAEGFRVFALGNGTEEFRKQFQAMFGKEPSPYSAQGYDAYMALAQTIKLSQENKSQVTEELRKITVPGAMGNFHFLTNGDVDGVYQEFEVKQGKFQEVR